MKLKLGDRAKHKISGFEGTITAMASYLTGCDRVALTPDGLDEKGKPKEPEWFDDSTIEGMSKKKNGGGANPVARKDPP